VPVGIVTGLVCRNKLREAAPANDDNGKRKPFYKGLPDDITADVRQTAPQPQTPANANTLDGKVAAQSFNTEAEKPAAPKAPPKPAPQSAADAEAEAMRKRAAEERARARRKR